MLTIRIPECELYDDETQLFEKIKGKSISLEHSLVSISKWESFTEKAFMNTKELSTQETMLYLKCMTITPNVEDLYYSLFSPEDIDRTKAYIDAKMTATTFGKIGGPKNKDVITSELIYYWMVALNIPFECQKWHLNRLLALINICNIKNTPPKKMSKREAASRNNALNAARRQQLNTKG